MLRLSPTTRRAALALLIPVALMMLARAVLSAGPSVVAVMLVFKDSRAAVQVLLGLLQLLPPALAVVAIVWLARAETVAVDESA